MFVIRVFTPQLDSLSDSSPFEPLLKDSNSRFSKLFIRPIILLTLTLDLDVFLYTLLSESLHVTFMLVSSSSKLAVSNTMIGTMTEDSTLIRRTMTPLEMLVKGNH